MFRLISLKKLIFSLDEDMYFPAVFMPLMTLNVLGLEARGSIFKNVMVLYRQGFVLVAAMVFITAVLLPFLNPCLLFLLALLARLKRLPGLQAWILRTYHHLEEEKETP